MSRKSKRNRPAADGQDSDAPQTPQRAGASRRGMIVSTVLAVGLALLVGSFLFKSKGTEPSRSPAAANVAALASEHSPTVGEAGAKVHVVEFLDPACETCALFFPLVKQLMADNPGKIRLSVRHVAFHDGSAHVVRLLEASRAQGKYWETLEALLSSQARWAPNHTVLPDLVAPVIAGVGLDLDQLSADMNSPEVERRMAKDMEDAAALKVTATPEYFVNGRPLPSFGQQQLLDLVNEELQRAY